ncbi:hypothetical protein R3P38DRAFT_1374186 [Favolaschia claudopus]|uniref:Uncharacterized protein n=1 Tax=Favolaschia claudopus TaxID=2862362 RepID=A0AAW0DYF1_9AGAR
MSRRRSIGMVRFPPEYDAEDMSGMCSLRSRRWGRRARMVRNTVSSAYRSIFSEDRFGYRWSVMQNVEATRLVLGIARGWVTVTLCAPSALNHSLSDVKLVPCRQYASDNHDSSQEGEKEVFHTLRRTNPHPPTTTNTAAYSPVVVQPPPRPPEQPHKSTLLHITACGIRPAHVFRAPSLKNSIVVSGAAAPKTDKHIPWHPVNQKSLGQGSRVRKVWERVQNHRNENLRTRREGRRFDGNQTCIELRFCLL